MCTLGFFTGGLSAFVGLPLFRLRLLDTLSSSMFDIVAAALLGGETKSSTPFLFTGCTCFGLPVLGWGGAGFSLRGQPLPLFGSLGPSNSLQVCHV